MSVASERSERLKRDHLVAPHKKMAELASPDGKCTATKSSGEKCRGWAVKGTRVCTHHGGGMEHVKAAGRVRLARDKAQQEALKRLREEKASKQDVITEMDRLAAEVIAFKDVVRERLDYLLEHEDIRYEGKTGEQTRAEITLYERALDRCNTVLATNVKLNIAERRVELDKAKAILVAGVIRAILARLDLTDMQQRMVPGIVQEEMLALSAEVS